jgi:hypothetical protein
MRNYAKFDDSRERYYVTLDGRPHYFPIRQRKRISFEVHPRDPYARLFSQEVVSIIEQLSLPRYGLAQFLVSDADSTANTRERHILRNLNRAGPRLIGFCRTNLFKRLESSGYSFLLSVDRHIRRNLVALYALEHRLPIPIGTQDAAMLDTSLNDTDDDYIEEDSDTDGQTIQEASSRFNAPRACQDASAYMVQAEQTYATYASTFKKRFDWLDPRFFKPELKDALQQDMALLLRVLSLTGPWDPDKDTKLQELYTLLTRRHQSDKLIIFTQFADTALYLAEELRKRGLEGFAVATAETADPVALARRFSPSTNGGLRPGESELWILIATDVLAEGQNLQDAHIVVNYDLPWAIIRLIQRAGRVDRIGQRHDTMTVYSFLPADGVERIIGLCKRLVARLKANQEVIGTDESFFGEGEANKLGICIQKSPVSWMMTPQTKMWTWLVWPFRFGIAARRRIKTRR